MGKLRFLMQGSSELENHRLAVKELESIKNLEGVLIGSAFLRSEGVEAIEGILRKHSSITKVYIGCRNGVTSFQGVCKLLDFGIKPFLIDTGSLSFIFHPKTFVSFNKTVGISIVGSANLTMGGLVKNIEASTVAQLDLLGDEEDKLYLQSILSAYNLLETGYPKNVTQINNKLEAQDFYNEGKLVDENISRTREFSRNLKGDDEKEVTPSMKIKIEKYKPSKDKVKETELVKEKTNVSVTSTPLLRAGWTKVWESKELKERDLNIPKGSNTHLTGSMTLKKGLYEHIDQREYFRNKVFQDLSWTNKPNKGVLEYANVDCYILVEGINYGKYTLEVKHDPRTDTASYRQNNAMTHLMWKEARKFIAKDELLGKKMRIYKINNQDNEFVIDISDFEEYDLGL